MYDNDRKIRVTFRVSDDAEARDAKETKEYSTTIVYQGWTPEDFDLGASKPVIIGQIQPKLRTGKFVLGEYFLASRPGTRASQPPMDEMAALVKICGGDKDKAYRYATKFGSAKNACDELQRMMDEMDND